MVENIYLVEPIRSYRNILYAEVPKLYEEHSLRDWSASIYLDSQYLAQENLIDESVTFQIKVPQLCDFNGYFKNLIIILKKGQTYLIRTITFCKI